VRLVAVAAPRERDEGHVRLVGEGVAGCGRCARCVGPAADARLLGRVLGHGRRRDGEEEARRVAGSDAGLGDTGLRVRVRGVDAGPDVELGDVAGGTGCVGGQARGHVQDDPRRRRHSVGIAKQGEERAVGSVREPVIRMEWVQVRTGR
jgi:hypothetical protein